MGGRFRYSSWGTWWHGRQDGRRGIPTADQQSLPPYLRELKELAERMMHDVSIAWLEEDKKLKPEYCLAKGRVERGNSALQEAKEIADKEKEERDAAKRVADEKRDPPALGKKTYLFLAGLIGVLEYPLNAIVFQVFGQSVIETRLISALLVVIIPLAGHFLGVFLREERFLHSRVVLAKFSCMLTFLLTVLLGIAYIRELFVVPSMKETIGEDFSPTAVTITFLGINLLLASVVTALSYFAHDPHPEMPKARDVLRTEQKEFEAAEAARKGVGQAMNKAQEVFDQIANRRQAVFKKRVEEANEIKNRIDVIVQMYWNSNIRNRADNKPPQVYDQSLVIAMPEGLNTLDCDCPSVGDEEEPS